MPIAGGAVESELTLTCLRCGNSWPRRSLNKLPVACPGCYSPYWDCPRKAEPPITHPLSRTQALQVAYDVIRCLHGYRKNPDYRTFQNDLNFICTVLQRVSYGETRDLTRPEGW
jgi:hypothetical protein